MLFPTRLRPKSPMIELVLAAIFCGMALGQSSWPQQGLQSQRYASQRGSLPAQQILGRGPRTANPYLAYLPPGTAPDFEYWDLQVSYLSHQRRQEREKAARLSGLPYAASAESESEPNDTQSGANFLDFGTGGGDRSAIDIFGGVTRRDDLVEDVLDPLLHQEDDGSIGSATPIPVTANRTMRINGTVGDGPFGSSGTGSGDFDLFQVSNLSAGRNLIMQVDTSGSPLDSIVFVLDSSGSLLAFSIQRFSGTATENSLAFRVPESGTYYVAMTGYPSFLFNPFDSSSGSGAGSEGSYELTVGIDIFDGDFFSFDLEAGDIVGFNALGAASTLSLVDSSGMLRILSAQDLSGLYPSNTPLPGGGNAVLAYVAESPGRYALRVDGLMESTYQVEARVFRREERSEAGGAQTLFIDFDGATISGPGALGGGAILSPLAAFLPNFGLSADDEDAVIDAILAAVEENLSQDLRELGNNGDFDQGQGLGDFEITILNSRDHPDRFGSPNVSRVIVGGTTAELGISTIGIAESIDVGNFRTDETGFVLLDVLGAPNGQGLIESFARAEGFSIIDAIGIATGNIVAHEAGHFFGNYHTENFETLPNIMDQGGNPAGTFGVGDDQIFGTDDDIDVDFGPDIYIPNEGFQGLEDTLNTIAFGLSSTISTLFFPQFGNGSGFVSEILLSNPEPRPAVGNIRLFNAGGDLLDLGGAFSGVGQFEFNGQRIEFTIPPLGSLRVATDGLGQVQAGSARVAANPPVGGAVRFEITGVGVAGVGKASPVRAALVPVQRGGGVNTGIAVQNTNQVIEVTVELTLRDIDGLVVPGGVRSLTLPPNGREAIFIDELFPSASTEDFRGSVTLASTIPVAALALELASGQVTTLPVVELP